jgi:tRNA (guanine37-N1)-methyltransferase
MLMVPDVLTRALESVRSAESMVILTSPRGEVMNQKIAQDLAKEKHLIFVAGHYEGVDQRFIDLSVDREISIGDYVLTGGELPAMVLIDTMARFIDGVLAGDESVSDESIYSGLLEYPQYSKPRVYDGDEVPEILLSGNHGEIDLWRWEQALALTKERRPDLFAKYLESDPELSKKQKAILQKYTKAGGTGSSDRKHSAVHAGTRGNIHKM